MFLLISDASALHVFTINNIIIIEINFEYIFVKSQSHDVSITYLIYNSNFETSIHHLILS